MESEGSKTDGGTIIRSSRGSSFSLQEDENLCKAWLAVKEEMLGGLSQKGSHWDRILKVYNQLMGGPTQRTPKAVSSRWLVIQQNVNIFHVCLQCETNKDASASLDSRIAGAKREFCVSQKFPFKWNRCWEILKDNTHWRKYQVTKLNMKDANKRLKPMLENNPLDIECASSTPTTPRSEPTTPTLNPCTIITNPASSEQTKETEIENKNEEQIVHFSKVVEETDTFLKDNTIWRKYQSTKLDMDANKKLKPMLKNDSIDIECASSTRMTQKLQPTTPTLIPMDMNTNAASSGQMKVKESENQLVHLSNVVEETNTLLKTFMCSVDERLKKSEDIARRHLQVKEDKIQQRQLETRESQFERDRQIMDMNLEHMPAMQRQFYEMKQREICERWKIGEAVFAGEGSSGELECVVGGSEL